MNAPPSKPDETPIALRIFVAHPSSLLTDHQPHGDGLLAFRFISELARRGHRLHVAAEQVDLSRRLSPNVHIYQLGAIKPRGARDRLEYMWRMRRLFARLQGSERFDVVHQLNPVHVGMTLAIAHTPVPIVLGPYVPDWADRNSDRAGVSAVTARLGDGVRYAVAALQQRNATTVLLSTPAATSKLAAPRSALQIHELPYGIDEQAWAPPDRHDPHQNVLFVGRLHVHKGIFVLLEAFENLARDLPEATLSMAGAGPAADELAARVQVSPARRQIELLGSLDREQVLRATQECDVYCLPSFGEPFGLGALEAMACAKPVVATDASGLHYLVSNEGGRQVAPGDVYGLSRALADILGNSRLQRSMGAHNRAIVETRYAWPRVVDRLETIYLQAIHTRRTGSRHGQ